MDVFWTHYHKTAKFGQENQRRSFRMSSIRITSVPPGPGHVPEWVRQGWVGVAIPLSDEDTSGPRVGVLGDNLDGAGGYSINIIAAVNALGTKSRGAARWWKRNVMMDRSTHLVVSRDVCELIPS